MLIVNNGSTRETIVRLNKNTGERETSITYTFINIYISSEIYQKKNKKKLAFLWSILNKNKKKEEIFRLTHETIRCTLSTHLSTFSISRLQKKKKITKKEKKDQDDHLYF